MKRGLPAWSSSCPCFTFNILSKRRDSLIAEGWRQDMQHDCSQAWHYHRTAWEETELVVCFAGGVLKEALVSWFWGRACYKFECLSQRSQMNLSWGWTPCEPMTVVDLKHHMLLLSEDVSLWCPRARPQSFPLMMPSNKVIPAQCGRVMTVAWGSLGRWRTACWHQA
jgi:hypothetical protein